MLAFPWSETVTFVRQECDVGLWSELAGYLAALAQHLIVGHLTFEENHLRDIHLNIINANRFLNDYPKKLVELDNL